MAMTDAELDALIAEAGQTHVIRHREDPAVLERLRDPAVLARAKLFLGSKDKPRRNQAILCIERIGFVLQDQDTAVTLLYFAAGSKDKYEIHTALNALASCKPPRPIPAAPLLDLLARAKPLFCSNIVDCMPLAPHDEIEP